jgi:selenocysteine lyase/cysteine desulfurase
MTAPSPTLAGQRQAFVVPDDVAYFNTSSLAPLLRRVQEAGEAALRRRAEPWAIAADDWFSEAEALRARVGALLGDDAEGVALVPATSYGMAVAARNLVGELGAERGVLVVADEYPSGVHTWRRAAADAGATVVTAAREPGQTWTDAVLAALDDRIGVASVPTVHWTDGAPVDLDAVAAGCREAGARLVVDASQSLGVVPLDVAALRPDAVVSVGYKWLLGVVGRSFMWVAPSLRDGRPLEENWIVREGADDFAALVDYRDEYQPGARRYDQGQRSLFELTPMAIAALDQIGEWGVDRIASSLAGTTAAIVERLAPLGLTPTVPPTERSPHILGVELPAEVRERAIDALAARDCHAALRGTVLRIAPHLHVTGADVDRLVTALSDAL